jgi:hypothetical protein
VCSAIPNQLRLSENGHEKIIPQMSQIFRLLFLGLDGMAK